ncbi:hypothetical protein D0Y60_06590 [Shinella sp. WSJ-2]|uniref:tetratricopeptide repeat protein n=1 Tax=Shinella sp. WSJ-2 TaxID=2303749 RepID=UPI000E3D6E0C|nr:tetratricopeptide repeat protein [Shinella sp. WSJ-2]RFZ88821.1 hypothetical protein D0Y60_06590 [Shinella sp. WSJ-2]
MFRFKKISSAANGILLRKSRAPKRSPLAIVFSSVNSNGFSYFKLFEKFPDIHVLYLRDPADLWYTAGINKKVKNWAQLVSEIAAIQKKLQPTATMTFGSSMGGYAALKLAASLPCDLCVATSPQTILDTRLPHTPANSVRPEDADLKDYIEKNPMHFSVLYFGAADFVDIYNVKRINWINTKIVPVADQDHLVAAYLTRIGAYDRIIKAFSKGEHLDSVAIDGFINRDDDCLEGKSVAIINRMVETCYLGGDDAIEVMAKELDTLEGNWADAQHLVSKVLLRNNDPTGATHYAREAARRAPLSITIADTYASTLVAAGRRDEAIEAYRRCLVIRPKHYSALCSLSELLLARGQRTEAVKLLKTAIEIRPRLPRARTILNSLKTSPSVPER